jgi:ubiquinone/menaquinone biosynthesis C-methylase UbiE
MIIMGFSLNGFIYQVFIDPLISGLRKRIVAMIEPEETVIDIACGTGAMALAIAQNAGHVTGIDLAEDMIITALRTAQRKGIKNISFKLQDATDLSGYAGSHFDVAVTSMAMHQFDPEVAVKVLSEMGRIAKRVIIADYNCPMKTGPAAALAWSIERAARGDHYRNFRKYMARGGVEPLFDKVGLKMAASEVRGSGVFVVAQGSELRAREKGSEHRARREV